MGEQSDLRKRCVARCAGKRKGKGPDPTLRGSAGSVLLVLIVTMVVLAALTAAILPARFTSEMGQVSATQAMKAYYLAEAGGRYTIARLQDLSSGAHTFKFDDGYAFFEINKITNGLFTSTGVVAEGRTLEARVTLTYRLGSRFDHALFGDDGVATGSSVVIDSYSSSAEPTDGEHGDVGTNADNLDGMDAGTELHGELEVLADRDVTPEGLPSGAASWEDKTAELDMSSNNQTVNLGAGEYYTAAVDLTNGSTVNISGDVVLYVEGTTGASPNATLNISAGASLTIYAGGDLNLSGNFILTPDQIPAHFLIYGLAGCQDIEWGSTCGAIYAPAADILLINNAVAYGALIGKTVTLQNDVEVHYDEDLQGIGSGDSTRVAQYFTPN
ncbi:MAG: hypothetical protein JRD89_16105 [Deltaproteobacteria bacterium]|nr:hypothetical protein [Deltaproteobacteria bacterium]